MPVLLDRKRLDSSLPNAPDGGVPTLVMSHVCGQQPMHPRAEIAVAEWANDKMDVVRHEAPSEQAHRPLLASALKQVRERVEIRIVMENGLPGVAA
jgi:hypothetical protein